MSEKRLTGKVALVTGASRGIGAATARRLAADGARVVVNYNRSPGPAEQVVASIRQAGGQAVAVKADVSDPSVIEGLFDAATKAFGPVSILVNNAAIVEPKPVHEVDLGTYERQFNLNVRGLRLHNGNALEYLGQAIAHHRQGLTTPMLQGIG
jgi:3-oxoacyl-[acyl-carrier protein] reductase